MDLPELIEIISNITYKDGWEVRLFRANDGTRYYIQVEVSEHTEAALDPRRKSPPQAWRGGKHYLSPHMCRQEVVGVCYSAIEKAELHEIREWFRYRGAAIFNPHLDPDVLAEVASKASSFNVRDNAMMIPSKDDHTT